jgi:uncharacterized membrane protein YphA (DoxX/SURF4 family)
VAIGKSGDCTPTANTAECYAWCEHAWTPWANNLLSTFKIPYKVRCNKSNGYELAKIIAAVEIIGYLMLWMPGKAKKGAFILTATMAFAIHFHVTFLKDSDLGKFGCVRDGNGWQKEWIETEAAEERRIEKAKLKRSERDFYLYI